MLSSPPSPARRPEEPGSYFLAADVGGTHARVGLARNVRDQGGACPVELLHREDYVCADWPGLGDILVDFVARLAATPWRDNAPTACVLACPGYVQGDQVVNRNLPWPVVSISQMQAQLGMADLTVMNDFEALAHAVPYVQPAEMRPLMTAQSATGGLAAGPIVVMGPGTGLGCAAILPGSPAPQVLPTEAAHVALAASTPRELDILRVLAGDDLHVPVESALSGPGLLRLYRAISTLRGETPTLQTPADVTASALERRSDAALEALNTFCALLGSFAADLAALYGAQGGILLAGGILPKIEAFLQQSEFRKRFLHKGVLSPFLERVPVHIISHGDLGVLGAACWLEGRAARA
ncbi:glucokinase [Pelomonas cellulosilytica]|uniref:Glucokinase n=1 Tax=Pelomonas cellulosilytica TaxID=2906762 RepID=A0ABS8XQA9_9BURK|nr:glucokinase [Pelomonas sp. P8]MCE4553910.1 glucokinase [Pelomonas sp. P8]